MKKKHYLFILILTCIFKISFSQEYEEDEKYEEDYYSYFLNDNTKEGQIAYVEDLLAAAGYVIIDISVYQTLPNNARVFKVIANDSLDRGFIFIRWDKKKQENFVANKMIDPGVYYNLKTAEKILRVQTTKTYFTPDEALIQPMDRPILTRKDIENQEARKKVKEKNSNGKVANQLNGKLKNEENKVENLTLKKDTIIKN